MRAEIVSIGTELLLGEILDTNAQYLGSRLPALGIDLFYVSKVGDNRGRLAEVLGRAWERSDLVLATGGLGPTDDDLTREAIADVLREEAFVDATLEAELRQFFAGRGMTMPDRNVKQASLIPSARAISNPRGTAPGWWVERDGRVIVAMPGPPVEMHRMWEEEVAPELKRRHHGAVLVTRTLKTAGLGEAAVDELISPFSGSANPTIGVYARADGVHVRVAGKAPTEGEAMELIKPVEEDLRRALGPAIWGADENTLESAVGAILDERNLTLSTMESCTGGLLASTITDVPGSSRYFRGGLVSYATEAKIGWGVNEDVIAEHGVISSECAHEMARAARQQLESDIGVGVTGVAGPDLQDEKPPGTIHIAIESDSLGSQQVSYQFAQGREAVKRRAVTTSLVLLLRLLTSERR
jgi:nicotinamide-nucleotide amidase